MHRFELSPQIRAASLAAGLAAFVGGTGPASADVAPAPDYVEQCTVAVVQEAGEQCVSCGDSYHGDREACARRFEPEGYARRCRTRGASTWDEVWCRPADAVASPVSDEDSNGFAQPPPAESQPDSPQIASDPAPGPPMATDPPPQRAAPGGGCGGCVIGAHDAPTGTAVAVLACLAALGVRRVRRQAQR